MRPEIPFYPFMFKNITLTMMLLYLLDQSDRQRAVHAIDQWLNNNSITELIALQLPLAEAAKAHEAVEKSGSRFRYPYYNGSAIMGIS